jgi:hypothetical protein
VNTSFFSSSGTATGVNSHFTGFSAATISSCSSIRIWFCCCANSIALDDLFGRLVGAGFHHHGALCAGDDDVDEALELLNVG